MAEEMIIHQGLEISWTVSLLKMLQAVEASDGDDSDLLSLAKVGMFLEFETQNIYIRNKKII